MSKKLLISSKKLANSKLGYIITKVLKWLWEILKDSKGGILYLTYAFLLSYLSKLPIIPTELYQTVITGMAFAGIFSIAQVMWRTDPNKIIEQKVDEMKKLLNEVIIAQAVEGKASQENNGSEQEDLLIQSIEKLDKINRLQLTDLSSDEQVADFKDQEFLEGDDNDELV